MKKLLKNPIFTYILGFITAVGITSVLAYSILAPDVGFTPREESWNVDNVKDALDDLKEIAHRFGYVKSGIKVDSGTTIPVEAGSYIVISSVDAATVTNSELIVSPDYGGIAAGVGAWASVHRATSTSVTVTILYGRQFNYYVFR